MTLQSSGAISLLDLRTEFGVSGTVDFSTFYSGTEGAVPPPFNGFNDDIPTSGSGTSISLNDFYGAQNTYEVTITSVGSAASKLSEVRGFVRDSVGNIANDGLVPNLQGKIVASNSSFFLGSNITLSVSAINNEGGFGSDKTGAWTTVTWFAQTTTVKYRKNQMSVSGRTGGGANYVVQIGTVSEGARYWPHVPTGGIVRIRFENNG